MARSGYRIVPLVVVAPAGLEPGQDGEATAAAQHPEHPQQGKVNHNQDQGQDQCYCYRVHGAQDRRRLVDALVALHVACIQFDGALMRFHPPFGAAQRQRMRLFWDERVAQAEAGRRLVLLTLPAAASVPAPVPVPGAGADVNAGGGGVGGVGLGAGDGASEHQSSGDHHDNEDDVNAGIDIAGVVELATPDTDTGPFRADVEMLMVSPDHRRAGLGKRLMAAVEDAARQRGRTLLQLSTTAGSVAEERLYPALGYTKLGTVPNYGISPVDGQLVDGVYFYKDLSRPPTAV